jgi:predicted transposase YbfD/YdcC
VSPRSSRNRRSRAPENIFVTADMLLRCLRNIRNLR